MKHQLSQRPIDSRPRYSILALVIALFALPYFTDVGYYADQTPTHDAQENSKVEGKAEAGDNKTPLTLGDVQNDSVGGHGLIPQDVYKNIAHPTRGTPVFQRLCHTLIISRPPPAA